MTLQDCTECGKLTEFKNNVCTKCGTLYVVKPEYNSNDSREHGNRTDIQS